MNYFPMFVSLEGKKCLIAGGGKIAFGKAEKLLLFGADVVAVAPSFVPQFEKIGITLVRGAYTPELLDGAYLAIAATDDKAVNARVAADCRARGIPVNSADDKENCTFFFPALVLRGDVTVGISTGGASPYLAARLRERAEEAFPQSLKEICERAKALRGSVSAEEYARAVEDMLHEN